MTRLRGALLLVATVVLAGCGGAKYASPAPVRPHAPERVAAPFSRDSVWNSALPADARVDPRSWELIAGFVADIERQRRKRIGPWIQTTESSTPVYTVPRDQRRVRVELDVRQPYGRTLRRAFKAVPLPDEARPARGPDKHLTVVQPSTDSLWEFWHLRREDGRWRAAWGGAMRNVSRNLGYFTRTSWSGGRSYWGATATSLPLLAGLIRIREFEQRRIDHALAIAIPNARADVAAWPAQRSDGTLDAGPAIPEGARLRLDPELDIPSLHLPPVAAAIAIAAQRYGMIVRDKTLHATGFFAEDPTPTGTNPYPRLFGGRSPSELLARFPWDHLQVVRMDLRRAR